MKRLCIMLVAVALLTGVAQGVTQGNLVNRYSFTDGDTEAIDSVSGKNGTLEGTADIAGNQLVLDGDGYVNLPGDILDPGLTSLTIESWFDINVRSDWQRLFDFGDTVGNDGGWCLFYCPTSGWPDDSRLVMGAKGPPPSWGSGEDAATGPIVTEGTPICLAAVYDGDAMELRLYQDGALIGSTATTQLLSDVARNFAYIGASVYPLDPKLNGNVDEFRIWNAAFTDADALASCLGGPGVVIPEPATIALLGLGGLALLRRRK